MAFVQTAFDFNAHGARAVHGVRGAYAARPVATAPMPAAAARTTPPATHAAPDARGLELALRAELDTPLRVTITDNRRTMISLRKRPGFTELRLHHMFLTAEAGVVRALGAYVARSDRDASVTLGRFIEAHRTRIRRRVTRNLTLRERGLHHDLAQIHAEINARYFEGKVEARITWGREPGRAASPRRDARASGHARSMPRARRSIKLGSYCSRDQLIRVHPTLDAEWVPRFFVEYIVYHEMLHAVLPPIIRGGRRQLHDRRFKTLERAFPDYEKALRWEREHLDRLLSC